MMGPLRLAAGSVFAGEFEILEPLAEGGMGTVYVARTRAGDRVALKVLHPELVSDEVAHRRFSQESKLIEQLQSPHAVRVLRSGIEQDGRPWIAMELLQGKTLRQYVDGHGALAIAEVGNILMQLCEALAEAHRHGMVHRDLKPENVFLHDGPNGRIVKLLDFGVAKVLDLNRTSGTGTAPVGSPLWMAPEQTSAGNRISPATDVWALALISFWMLTGRHYWISLARGGVSGLLREMHIDPIERASTRAATLAPAVQLPPGYDEWFARALARNSMERFQDASEAIAALRPVLGARGPDRSALAFASTLAVNLNELRPDQDRATQPDAIPAIVPTNPPPPAPSPKAMPAARPAPAPASTGLRPASVALIVIVVLVLGMILAFASAAAVWVALTLTDRHSSSETPHIEVAPAMEPVQPTTPEPPPSPPALILPVATGQSWRGAYYCGVAMHPITLHITNVAGLIVDARLEYISRGEPVAYTLRGTYQTGGRMITLHPREWIQHPQHLQVMSGLDGQVGLDDRQMYGRVLDAQGNCNHFRVELEHQ